MAPKQKKSKLPSHQTHSKGTAHGADDNVKRFCPKFDEELTPSKLTRGEMNRRVTVDMSAIDLDLRNPEKSKWLAQNLEELGSEDSERRLIALWRLDDVLVEIGVKEGSSSEMTAPLSAYMLEQGILNEIIVRLKAAQDDGDFYLFSEALLHGDSEKLMSMFLDQGYYFVLSKVMICCDTLTSLMADARTVRFIRKAIPDLISILEGVYLSKKTLEFAKQAKEVSVPLKLHNNTKLTALFTLGALAESSTLQDKSFIARRKVLLQQILTDASEGTDFSRTMSIRVITCFSHLCLLPEFHDSLKEDLARVCLNTMQVADFTDLIKQAFNTLVMLMAKNGELMVAGLRSPSFRKAFLTPLLAVAGSPLKLDTMIRPYLHQLICTADKSFTPLFNGGDPSAGFWKRAATYPGVSARALQLCRMCSVNQSTARDERAQGRKERVWVMNDLEEVKARQKPCRKCSRSSCPNSESAPRQFMLCSKCRLAIYCSKECQRLAWKEGHRDRCRPAGAATELQKPTEK